MSMTVPQTDSTVQEEILDSTQDSGIGDDISKSREEKKRLLEFTMGEVGMHSDSRSCWIVLYDFVYDVTEFLHEHPGGMEIILEHAGRDGTGPFTDKGHTADAKELLKQYCIGQLVESERLEDKTL